MSLRHTEYFILSPKSKEDVYHIQAQITKKHVNSVDSYWNCIRHIGSPEKRNVFSTISVYVLPFIQVSLCNSVLVSLHIGHMHLDIF